MNADQSAFPGLSHSSPTRHTNWPMPLSSSSLAGRSVAWIKHSTSGSWARAFSFAAWLKSPPRPVAAPVEAENKPFRPPPPLSGGGGLWETMYTVFVDYNTVLQ